MTNKLSEIEELSISSTNPSDSITRLLELSFDEDEEVRYRAIEAFENFAVTDNILERVRCLLNDCDELVRVQAVELLGYWRDSSSCELIYKSLNDKSSLVRSSAIISLARACGKSYLSEMRRLAAVGDCAEQLSATVALYHLNEDTSINDITKYFFHNSYHIRCAAANLISEFVLDKDISKLVDCLEKAMISEKSNAVLSTYKRIIGSFENK